MVFKRTEGFRFTFAQPLPASFVIYENGNPQEIERQKHTCEIVDISPRGMKMFSYIEIGEHTNKQLEMHFILDSAPIKAFAEIVWVKPMGKNFQYGLIIENQPEVEELIVSELKIRRKKEVIKK